MRTIRFAVLHAVGSWAAVVALVASVVLPPAPVYASGSRGGGHAGGGGHFAGRGGGHGGGGWGWGLGLGLGLGLGFDALWGWPGYYSPYGYYPYGPYAYYPSYVPVAPAATAVQQAPPAQFWYYCDNPQGYYPYIATCQSPWRPVPATAPTGP